jgi:predicted RNA-binding Zn ribbon-like protein
VSKQSRQFNVPDAVATLYDFVNTLDLRSFAHQNERHQPSDALASPKDLAAWMRDHGLQCDGPVTSDLLDEALRLRESLREVLAAEPAARRQRALQQQLNALFAGFPLVVVATGADTSLRAARRDALAGLSRIAAEFHDAARDGSLARLKMCASDDCRRVFYDRSKPGTRRWCQTALCGNRSKTRAYRARLRANGE